MKRLIRSLGLAGAFTLSANAEIYTGNPSLFNYIHERDCNGEYALPSETYGNAFNEHKQTRGESIPKWNSGYHHGVHHFENRGDRDCSPKVPEPSTLSLSCLVAAALFGRASKKK